MELEGGAGGEVARPVGVGLWKSKLRNKTFLKGKFVIIHRNRYFVFNVLITGIVASMCTYFGAVHLILSLDS